MYILVHTIEKSRTFAKNPAYSAVLTAAAYLTGFGKQFLILAGTLP
jgi:hypothetical protein